MSSLWKHVKNEWFYTKLAAVVFPTAATLVVIFIAIAEFFSRSFGNPTAYSTSKEVAFTVAMMLAAVSNIFVVVGMFRFWVVCDRSRPIVRRVWFGIMIVGLLRLGLGAALYCFAVYLPQVSKKIAQVSERVDA